MIKISGNIQRVRLTSIFQTGFDKKPKSICRDAVCACFPAAALQRQNGKRTGFFRSSAPSL